MSTKSALDRAALAAGSFLGFLVALNVVALLLVIPVGTVWWFLLEVL